VIEGFTAGGLSSAIGPLPTGCFPIIEANASNGTFGVTPEPHIRGSHAIGHYVARPAQWTQLPQT